MRIIIVCSNCHQKTFSSIMIYFTNIFECETISLIFSIYSVCSLFFFSGPINTALSWGVWKRPWPNLEDVSINFNLISSNAFRFVCTKRDWKLNEIWVRWERENYIIFRLNYHQLAVLFYIIIFRRKMVIWTIII